MNQRPKILVLDRLQTGESANPSPEKILSGIPRTRVSNQYSDGSRQFFCGVWSSTSGKWRIRYTEDELCVLFEGRVRIESIGGGKHPDPPRHPFLRAPGLPGHRRCRRPPTNTQRALSPV